MAFTVNQNFGNTGTPHLTTYLFNDRPDLRPALRPVGSGSAARRLSVKHLISHHSFFIYYYYFFLSLSLVPAVGRYSLHERSQSPRLHISSINLYFIVHPIVQDIGEKERTMKLLRKLKRKHLSWSWHIRPFRRS